MQLKLTVTARQQGLVLNGGEAAPDGACEPFRALLRMRAIAARSRRRFEKEMICISRWRL
ncbi:hypothetical protein CK223_31035 [Mesorhizobium loti]|nr:hypothetical protein CK223_31035 [Mesorhizobium loti]